MTVDIELKTKVQVIYLQTRKDELRQEYATSEKRISIAEAEEILIDRQIEFKEVLKVKYEFINISLTPEELENNILL